jgi:predicted helicase
MLLPYYVAAMNLEHTYYERVGTYAPFEGLCLVDTFETEDQRQRPQLFAPENTERVKRQQAAKITAILGNPPYNAWQVNANDNNRNRQYEHVDGRVRETYAADSNATLKNALYDPYVKAIRWASDRVGEAGVVAFVTNNSFVDNLAFDGMRKHLAEDFDRLYVLDCGGNVRQNPTLSGTTHNVFGIQVGVSVNLFVKLPRDASEAGGPREGRVFYHRMGERWRKEERYEFLDEAGSVAGVAWTELEPDAKHRWLVDPRTAEFESFIPIGSKEDKAADRGEAEAIFKTYGVGVKTSRDAWVFGFDQCKLLDRLEGFQEVYNQELYRWQARTRKEVRLRDFLIDDDTKVKWSSGLRRKIKQGEAAQVDPENTRESMYRPFTRKLLYYDSVFVERPGLFRFFFPNRKSDNRAICLTGKAGEKPFISLMVDSIPDSHVTGPGTNAQCFPFYVYDEDGTNRRENVTDWALARFRSHYGDAAITKRDVFHYVYAVLHHPTYRERYAGALKRQLPRIPFAPAFRPFAEAGARLAALHVGYEEAAPYPLEEVEGDGPMQWRVEKMRLRDGGTRLVYNDWLTLSGIPEAAHRYRLGNRSAVEWLVDQYRVRTYTRYGLTHDPNDPDAKWHLVDLVKRVVTVSVETVATVEGLPELGVGR